MSFTAWVLGLPIKPLRTLKNIYLQFTAIFQIFGVARLLTCCKMRSYFTKSRQWGHFLACPFAIYAFGMMLSIPNDEHPSTGILYLAVWKTRQSVSGRKRQLFTSLVTIVSHGQFGLWFVYLSMQQISLWFSCYTCWDLLSGEVYRHQELMLLSFFEVKKGKSMSVFAQRRNTLRGI